MTEETKKQHQQNPEEESKPLIEDEVPPEEEPDHPGWLSLSEILKVSDPVFEKGLFLVGYQFSSNIYLLAGDYLTLVDPGNDYSAFMEFGKLGLKLTDIKKIVVTHGHRDHCMGTFELLRYPDIMQNKDVEIIIHAAGPLEFKKMVKQSGFTLTEIKGGETLELSGFEWEVVHTPGHTIDGICLYHRPTKTAITGDTVLPHAMGDVDKSAGGRLDHYLYGLKQLMKKDIENILPGHGVPVASTGMQVIEETYEGVIMKVIEADPEAKTPWMEGATASAERGLLEEAVYCCDKELAREPENLTAIQLKAFCLNDLGRCEESVELLDRILALQGDNVHALTAKGHALLGLQKFDESLKYFDEALGINPGFKDAQVFKGMALTFLGKHDEAMKIEAFKTEFAERFKTEIDKHQQQKEQGETDQST